MQYWGGGGQNKHGLSLKNKQLQLTNRVQPRYFQASLARNEPAASASLPSKSAGLAKLAS